MTEHLDFVARTLRNLGVDEAHVDLAVQKVFLLTMREDPRPEAVGDPAALFRAAAKVAEQARRRWPRRHPHEPSTRARLDSLLDSLPEEVREVFVLCEIEQHEEAWAAAALGHHQAWARTRLRRAQRAVCQKLGVPPPDQRKHPRLAHALSGEALRVLESGRAVAASQRARQSTLRAVDAVTSASVAGRITLLLSRVSLAIWLVLAIALGAGAYLIWG